MNSSDEFFICMQHCKQFDLSDRSRDDDLLASSSIYQIINKFEDITVIWATTLLIRKRSVNWCLENVLIWDKTIFWDKIDLIDRIRVDIDLNDELLTPRGIKFDRQMSGCMHIPYAVISGHQMIRAEISQKFSQFRSGFSHIWSDDYSEIANRLYFLSIDMNSIWVNFILI
jgi:hypothetical protein